MATLNDKFLNYDGLLYAFKKIIAYVKSSVGFKTNVFVKSITGTSSAPSTDNGINETKNARTGTYTTGKLDGTGTDVTNNTFTYYDTTYSTATTTKAGLMSASDYSKLADLDASTIDANIHAGESDEDTTTVQAYLEWLEDKVGSVNVPASASISSGTCTMTSDEMDDVGLENVRLTCNGWPAQIVDFDSSTHELTAYFIWRETTGSAMDNHYTAVYFKVDGSGNVTSLLTRRLLDTTDNRVSTIKNNADSSDLTGDVVVKKINGNSLVTSASGTITDIILKAGDINLTSAINTNEYTTSDSIQTVLSSINTKVNNIASVGLSYHILGANDSLPTASASVMGTVYLKPETGASGNTYDEWLCVDKGQSADPRYVWEKIGSTEVNLDIVALTNSNIDTCWDAAIAASAA